MFKVLEGCKSPERATKYSAAIDLFAAEDVVIKAGETAKVRLGVCIDLKLLYKIVQNEYEKTTGKSSKITCDDNNYDWVEWSDDWLKAHYLQLEPRSSLRAKGLIAGTGIIDLDFVYPNEICIILHNPMTGINSENKATCICSPNATAYKINKGEKIAQIMLCEHKTFLLGYESETERISGFGSTGK